MVTDWLEQMGHGSRLVRAHLNFGPNVVALNKCTMIIIITILIIK